MAAGGRKRNGSQGAEEGFQDGLILTEEDLQHPCIRVVQEAFPGRIRLRSSTVREDACVMIHARNLALSYGTWGPTLSRLNRRLYSLHVPFGDDGGVAGASSAGY